MQLKKKKNAPCWLHFQQDSEKTHRHTVLHLRHLAYPERLTKDVFTPHMGAL